MSRRWVNVLRHDRQLRCPSRRAPLRVHVPVSPTCSYGCPIHPEFSYRHEQDATCSPKYFSVHRYDTANARPAGSPSHVSPGWRLIPSGSLAAAASWSRRRPYHQSTSYTRACKALHSPFLPFTMGCWAIADGSSRLIVAEPRRRMLNGTTQAVPDLERAIRDYVRAYVRRHGRRKTAGDLGVSRHTLWRFLERGHVGRAVPSAVLNAVGGNTAAFEAATLEIIIDLEGVRPDPALRPLPKGLEEALLLLCATPLATVDELTRFGRVPASTLRDRLEKLAKRCLVDSMAYHLIVLGARPQRRYFPTEKDVTAGGAATKGRAHMLRAYPVSKQWFRLLAERLDAVAVLYRVAALVADSDPHNDPVRVDHYRQGPYDMLLTLSGGRSIGLLRQGTSAAHFQPPLPPQEHQATAQQRDALRHLRADPRRPGHTPSHPFIGRPVQSIAGPSLRRRWPETPRRWCGSRAGAAWATTLPCGSPPTPASPASWHGRSACWTRLTPSCATTRSRIRAACTPPACRPPCRSLLTNLSLPSRCS